MLRHTALICMLLVPLSHAAAQGPPNKAGVPVEVVATASEYVPRSTTLAHPGHSYTNCLGSTSYFGQFQSYGDFGSFSGTADTSTHCSTTFSPPTESTLTAYRRVNYTIAKGEHALYLLSCTQTTRSTATTSSYSLMGALAGAFARSKCPAFAIGSKYTLKVRNTSDARLLDTAGGKPGKSDKLEFLSSVGLPAPTTQPAPPPQADVVSSPREAKVHITSSPSGGEIFVDGKFVGNTPSDISIAAGGHTVKVTSGGKEWSPSIQITSGEVSLHAEMPSDN